MRFSIFTHVEHKKEGKNYSAYAPYIREMNIWLNYVDEVEVVGPNPSPPPKGKLPPNPCLDGRRAQRGSFAGGAYNHSNLRFTTIPSLNLLSFSAIIKAVVKIPIILFRILRAMDRADHLHLRCPGNIGLLACICQIFFPRKQKTAKYAGNWDPKAKQPWSYRLQRWILSNTLLTRNMTVLVYGQWPDQTKIILPFFTASFSETEIEKIEKDFKAPYKFLFVGNLVPGKQPQLAIQLVESLNDKNIHAELHVYGDGVLKNELEIQAEDKDYIHLHGNQPLDVVKQAYKVSHFLILASKSEGWPKAVAEAMFFGCIPIVTPISCVPWMINYGSRGILIPEVIVERGKWSLPEPIGAGVDSQHVLKRGNLSAKAEQENRNGVEETVEKIIGLIKEPVEIKRMSMEAQEWSQQYTLEKFEIAIKDVLKV